MLIALKCIYNSIVFVTILGILFYFSQSSKLVLLLQEFKKNMSDAIITTGCSYCDHDRTNVTVQHHNKMNRAAWLRLANKYDISFYCISLQDANDRSQLVMKEFHRVGLCCVMHMYRPKRANYFLFGCWDSHRQVAKCGSETSNLVAVFEDDVCFDTRYTPVELCQMIDTALMTIAVEWWHMMSLGTISWWSMPYAANVLRNAGLCMHAYILSQRGMQWMIDHPPEPEPSGLIRHPTTNEILYKPPYTGVGIDTYMTTRVKSYCLSPMIAYQHQTIKGSHQQPLVEKLFLTPSKMKATQWWIPLTWTALIVLFLCGTSALTSFLVTHQTWDPLIWLACTGGFGIVLLVMWLCVITGLL